MCRDFVKVIEATLYVIEPILNMVSTHIVESSRIKQEES
jgi:hypothetical protein